MNQLIEATLAELVDKIENGSGDWVKDWLADEGMPRNFTTRRHYHGVNVLMLWAARGKAGYPTSQWASYKQWLGAGYQVKSGERSTPVFITKDALKRGGDPDNRDDHYRLLRAAFVFNAAQLTLPPEIPVVHRTAVERSAACEALIVGSGADIRPGPQPAYSPSKDIVMMPPIDSFTSADGYYATIFHELVHWTGHASRLARKEDGYAEEELVAEMGAAFTCATMGVAYPADNFAAYMREWLGQVKDKPVALMKAASAASKAHEWLTVSRETQEDIAMAS
jgi:antirestriction protein ArdC